MPNNRERMIRLQHIMRQARWAEKATLQQWGKDIGIDPSTLGRFERGEMGLSSDGFARVLSWLLARDEVAEQLRPIEPRTKELPLAAPEPPHAG